MARSAIDPARRWERLLTWLLGAAIAAVLRLLRATWRVSSDGLQPVDAVLEAGGQVLAVFWHGGFPGLFTLFGECRACFLVSRSFRGRVVGEVGRRFGYCCVTVPERKPGLAHPPLEMPLAGCRALAVAVDGPLGPRHRVKPGVVRLAAKGGYLVVPVGLAARRRWVARRRWDHLFLPLPFTRVHLQIAAPFSLRMADAEQRGAWTVILDRLLVETERQARARVAPGK